MSNLPEVSSDSSVVRRHRAHQGKWREQLGWPAGPPSDARARSRYDRLTNYFAEEFEGATPAEAGVNFVPSTAKAYAHERLAELRAIDGVAEPDRLWRNLLSSQPLAFSIAGHLRDHLDAAAQVFSTLTGRNVVGFARLEDREAPGHTLGRIDAEWFPPQHHHTGDRSGFDVAAVLSLADETTMLLTIEVKYVDSFSPKKLEKVRYADALEACGISDQQADELIDAGGSQFLRSVLLTHSVAQSGIAGSTSPKVEQAMAVVLGRADDEKARLVVDRFGGLDLPVATAYWSHDEFCDAAAAAGSLAAWAKDLRRRYVLDRT